MNNSTPFFPFFEAAAGGAPLLVATSLSAATLAATGPQVLRDALFPAVAAGVPFVLASQEPAGPAAGLLTEARFGLLPLAAALPMPRTGPVAAYPILAM